MEEDSNSSITKKVSIMPANQQDRQNVVGLDGRITSIPKPDYWADMFEQFVGRDGQHFLIAEAEATADGGSGFAGFIIGEARAWEFGSQPCGWVLTILVSPEYQGQGVGEQLFEAISSRMKEDGVETIRTMIARDDNINMSFFRAQGMMAGPFIELEKPVDFGREET